MNREDQLERRLSDQPVRQIPTEWRAQILSLASAAGSRRSARDPRPSLLSTLGAQLSTLFGSHPKAWAGLAGAWVVILALQLTSRDPAAIGARNTPPPSPEMRMVLRQQKLLLAELVERLEPRVGDSLKVILPRPRSERGRESATA